MNFLDFETFTGWSISIFLEFDISLSSKHVYLHELPLIWEQCTPRMQIIHFDFLRTFARCGFLLEHSIMWTRCHEF